MSIFNFTNYRHYLSEYIAHLPNKGRGQISKIASSIKIQPTLMSMILSGNRDLSIEHAIELSGYLEHTEIEAEYFILLVQLERSGTHKLKTHFKKKIEKLKSESTKILNRFDHEKRLSNEEQSIFYSSWMYSAIRLFCSTAEEGKTLIEIMERFQLSRLKILEIMEFLKTANLVLEEKGRYKMGVHRTFLEQGSPHLPRHHINWRLKAIQQIENLSEAELMFTFPHSISESDFAKLREELVAVIKKASAIVKDSQAENVGCLNIDLLWIKK